MKNLPAPVSSPALVPWFPVDLSDPRLAVIDDRTLATAVRLALLRAKAPELPLEERRAIALRGVPKRMRLDTIESAESFLKPWVAA